MLSDMPDPSSTTYGLGVSRRRILATGALLSGGALVGSPVNAQSTDSGFQQQGEPLACGDSIRGELTSDDRTGFRSDLHYHDEYESDGEEGGFVSISMTVVDGEHGETPDSGDDQPNDDDQSNGENGENGGDGENAGTGEDGEDGEDVDQSPPGDPYLYLLGQDGRIVAEDDDSGGALNAHITVPSLPASETYTVIATSWGEEEVFEYELIVECGDPFDREPIACGDTLVGELTPDDPTSFLSDGHAHDAYGFDGGAGDVVDISMNGIDAPVNDNCDTTFADPLLVLLDPDLNVIAWDDDSGGDLNARITAQLPTDGAYTLLATSWAPEMYFVYELSLACRPPLEPELIECGETIAEELSPDDDSGVRNEFGQHFHDTYAFDGTAGDSVTITMQADRHSANQDHHDFPLGDPYLYLFDPDGQLVAEDDDSAGDFGAMIQHMLASDGEYVIVATSFGATEFFPYTLTLACEDDSPPLPEPTTIECGETVAEAIEPTDSTGFISPNHFYDHYEFEATASTLATISMSSSDGDSLVALLDPDGELIAWDDDSGGGFDSLLSNVELDVDGTYSIIATSFDAAEFFDYELTLQCL